MSGARDRDDRRAPRPRRPIRLVRLVLGAAVLAGVLGLARALLVDVQRVVEQSMWPALEGGDHVLIARLGTPERWEIWTYERPRPEGGTDLRIKRVLAAGGEFVDFRTGDLWIGRSREALVRALRPPEILEAMLVPLVRDCGPERLNVSGGGTAARTASGALELRATSSAIVAALRGGLARTAEGIEDDYLGNDVAAGASAPLYHAGRHPVPDVRVDVTVLHLEPGATLAIRHELWGGEMRAVVLGPGGFRVMSRSGLGSESTHGERPRPEMPIRLRLQTIDGTFSVSRLDPDTGAVRETWFEAPRDTERFGFYSRVSLELDRGLARLDRLDVARDVHYFWPPRLAEIGPYFVGAGEVYLVGDNVPASDDSRAGGPVSRPALRGRATRIVWPRSRARDLP